jgi:hypothetical protein
MWLLYTNAISDKVASLLSKGRSMMAIGFAFSGEKGAYNLTISFAQMNGLQRKAEEITKRAIFDNITDPDHSPLLGMSACPSGVTANSAPGAMGISGYTIEIKDAGRASEAQAILTALLMSGEQHGIEVKGLSDCLLKLESAAQQLELKVTQKPALKV